MDIRKVEKISKALGDPHRIAILQELKKKEEDCLQCSEINELLDLTQPSVSHHMKQLVDADIIISIKEGRQIKYSLNQEVLDQYIHFLSHLK